MQVIDGQACIYILPYLMDRLLLTYFLQGCPYKKEKGICSMSGVFSLSITFKVIEVFYIYYILFTLIFNYIVEQI